MLRRRKADAKLAGLVLDVAPHAACVAFAKQAGLDLLLRAQTGKFSIGNEQ